MSRGTKRRPEGFLEPAPKRPCQRHTSVHDIQAWLARRFSEVKVYAPPGEPPLLCVGGFVGPGRDATLEAVFGVECMEALRKGGPFFHADTNTGVAGREDGDYILLRLGGPISSCV